MCENRDFVVPVNILTPFVRTLFFWATQHTTMCLDEVIHEWILKSRNNKKFKFELQMGIA